MTIEEGDKVIKEFMGYKFCATYIKYHSSWDLLMPVVEKIENIGYPIKIKNLVCTVFLKEQSLQICKADVIKIKAIWLAVVEFINWYNKNK